MRRGPDAADDEGVAVRSLSLPSTAIVTAVSSAVVAVSSAATGASFVAVIVTVTVAVADPPWPSPMGVGEAVGCRCSWPPAYT